MGHPATKSLAMAEGSKLYFTGRACKQGHVAPRYVSSGHCTECNKVNVRVWGEENRQRKNELLRTWCAENKQRRKSHKGRGVCKPETKRAWAIANTEKCRASYRKYYNNNKSKFLTKVRNRAAALAGAEGTHTAADIKFLYEAQSGMCVYCRSKLEDGRFHVDHIVPVSAGGRNDKTNLQVLCAPCNLSKGAKLPEEYLRLIANAVR